MPTTVAEDILDYLETAGVGVAGARGSIVPGADMFEKGMPDQPDAAIAIREGGGGDPDFMLNEAGIALENPSLTVTIRGAKPAGTGGTDEYGDAYRRARQVRNVITRIANTAINGVRYLRARPIGDISDLGDDERGRSKFSAIFLVKKVPS